MLNNLLKINIFSEKMSYFLQVLRKHPKRKNLRVYVPVDIFSCGAKTPGALSQKIIFILLLLL